MSWNKTKKIYINWLTETNLKRLFAKKILYKNNLSLWWLTKLVDKDFINEEDWYSNLNKIFKKKKIKLKKLFYIKLTIKFLISLISKVLFHVLFKIFLYDKIQKKNYKNSIYVTNSNLKKYKNYVIDKQLGKFGIHQKLQNIYLINLDEDFNALKNILKTRKYLKNIPFDYTVLNTKGNVIEIIKLYFLVLNKLISLCIELNKKNYFILNNQDCSIVLKKYLISSFLGQFKNRY